MASLNGGARSSSSSSSASASSPILKVAVVGKRPTSNGGASSADDSSNSLLGLKPGNVISVKRPGSNLAAKQYGPFLRVSGEACPLFSSCCASDVSDALRRGTSYGVLSFGGVGNGKTTAMWGSPNSLEPENAIVPTACGELFALVDAASEPGDEVLVAASFLRVSAIAECQDDCLNPDLATSGLGLRLREAVGAAQPPWGEFYTEGLSQRVCADGGDLTMAALDGLDQAEAIDRLDESLKRGDRSHKLFTVTVLRRRRNGDLLRSTLHFLDTAGIPRPEATTKTASKPFGGKSAAERRKEMLAKKEAKKEDPTTKAIVRVVDSLADGLSHVPYRDAKLTRLLKGVLGGCGKGSWRGLVVGCVSSAPGSYAETEAMLQFLHKASVAPVAKQSAVPRGVVAPVPFVINAAAEISRMRPRTLQLARELCGAASLEAVDRLRPEDIHCDMQSPPEMEELRSLLSDRDQLLRDPFDEIRRATAGSSSSSSSSSS